MKETYGQVNGIINIQMDVKNASTEKIENFQYEVEKMLNDMMLFTVAEKCGFDIDSWTPATVEELDYEQDEDEE